MSDVMIMWFWPSRGPDAPNIGYGMHGRRFRWGLAVVAAAALSFVVLLVLGAPGNVLLWIAVAAVVGAALGLLRANGRYYELDQSGRPIRALADTQPGELSGRRPMTRRRFLASL
jgi:hypothetical protein